MPLLLSISKSKQRNEGINEFSLFRVGERKLKETTLLVTQSYNNCNEMIFFLYITFLIHLIRVN